jgi:hypothetical protein
MKVYLLEIWGDDHTWGGTWWPKAVFTTEAAAVAAVAAEGLELGPEGTANIRALPLVAE